MRLTQRGAAVLATAPVLAVAAWLFGLPEAAVLAVSAATLVLFAAVWTKLCEPRIGIERLVSPAILRVNETCRIQLKTTNTGHRKIAVLLLRDRVGQFGTVELQLAPLPPDEHNTASYRFPTHQRGKHRIDPTTVVLRDPFGLLHSTCLIGQATEVLVLPQVWPLPELAATLGEQNETTKSAPTFLSSPAEEFSGLRDFLPGDDLRRIHWPTTARLGRPVMRQFELPWQHRTTVLLDLRTSVSFERSVSAAASVVNLVAQQGGLIRLVTALPQSGSQLGIGFVNASEQLMGLQEHLAVVKQSETAHSLVEVLQVLDSRQGGRLVICTSTARSTEIAELQIGSQQFSSRILLTIKEAANIRAARTELAENGHWLHVDWGQGTSLDRAWAQATRDMFGTSP